VNYNFNSGVITGLTNGWTKDVPTGTDPLYIAAATAIGTGSDNILATEWSSPVLFVQNGTNTATITLYQTTTTATPVPVAPNIALTYTFADASIAETIPNGWKRTLPTTGTYRWMTTATAVNTTAIDSIAASEWSAVSLMGQDGINGSSAAIFGIDNAAAVFNKNLSNAISPSAGITLTTSYQNITGTLSYQWQKNGANLAGATSSSYTVPTSDYSSVTSNTYKVTITGTINGVSGSLSDNIIIPMLVDGGSSAVVLFSNDNIIFGAPNVLYSGIDFSNGTCDITAYIGSTELTYATSGANTFSLTYTASGATVGAGTNPTTKILRIPAPTAMSVESAVVTVTITPRDSAGNALPLIVRTLRYNLSRAGAVGMSYWLANTDYLKRSPSLVYSPTSITLSGYSATGSGIPAAYPCRFKIYEDGSATASYTSSVDEATKSYTPSTTAVKYIKVEMYLAGDTTTLVDYSTIPVVQDGSQALTLVEPNSAVLLSAASDGTVSASAYTGSGTTIKVLEGSTLLTFTTGVVGKGQFGVSTSVTNGTITVGGISGNGTTTCTVANHSGLTTNSASITYTINVVKLDGTAVTLTDVQTLTKSIAGVNGKAAVRAYQVTSSAGTSPTYTTSTSNGTLPGVSWSSTQGTVGANQFQWQIDGIADYSTGTTTWTNPYLSVFKVDTLAAFTVNTGALNVSDTLSIATTGVLKSGMTAFMKGTGYWLDYKTSTSLTTGIAAINILAGVSYRISSLGTTDWNLVAGTVGLVYSANSTIVAVRAGTGTGTVDETTLGGKPRFAIGSGNDNLQVIFISPGMKCTIKSLGNTTNAQWNDIAGTVNTTPAITYAVGMSFTAVKVGVGTGTVSELEKGIAWDGAGFLVAGNVVGTSNINALAVTEITSNIYYPTFTLPANSAAAFSTNTVFSSFTIPSVDVVSDRLYILTMELTHSDSNCGYFRITIGDTIFVSDANTRLVSGSNISTYTFVGKKSVAAKDTDFGPCSVALVNGTTTSFWNVGSVYATIRLSVFTGKR
jgi:hypothetical protein